MRQTQVQRRPNRRPDTDAEPWTDPADLTNEELDADTDAALEEIDAELEGAE
jgi:hypothetical protein